MNRTTLILLAVCCVTCALFCVAPMSFAADETPLMTTTSAEVPKPSVVSITEEYKFQEDDVIKMDVLNEQLFSGLQMRVTKDGKVSVPFLGELQAKDLTQVQLTQAIVNMFEEKQIVHKAMVQLTVVTLHDSIVRILGQVQRPGAIAYKDGDTILEAMASAGGYTETAMLENATLTRKGIAAPMPLDLRKMFTSNDLSQNYVLQRGDTIFVPQEDYQNKVYVLGYVARPGLYDLKGKTTVLDVISLAGGVSERGALRYTRVQRGDPAHSEQVQCNLTQLIDKGDLSQNILLQSGDVVIVPETKKPDLNKIQQFLSTILNLTYLRRYGLF